MDQEIEKLTGVPVNLIFDIEKEAGFRLRETAMLTELLQRENSIIATGGGVVVTDENRELLAQTPHTVVYLKTAVKHQLKRLKRDKQRPLLQGTGRRERLMKLAKERNPLYESVADLSFASGRNSAYGMAQKIADYLTKEQ